MVLFADITKSNDDLLFRGFPHEKPWSLEVKHKLSQPVFTHTASVSPSGLLAANASSKFAVPGGVDVTTTAGLDGSTVIRAAYCPAWWKGLTFSGHVNRNIWKGSTTIADSHLDMKRDIAHSRFGFNAITNTLNHSMCFNYGSDSSNRSVLVGYDVSLTKSDWSHVKCSVGAAISQESEDYKWLAAIKVLPYNSKPFGKVTGSLYSKAAKCQKAELGVEVSEIIPESKTLVSLGGLWYLDKNAKDTYIKAKIDHDGNLAACVGHKLHPDFTVAFGMMMDVTKGTKPSEPNVKFGASIKLQT